VVAAEPDYLARVREICTRHNVLFIADEIMCGSGRTGTYFAFEHDLVKPDLVTLAKGIGGGYVPLAATIISGDVASALSKSGFAHGHTYIGHPVACAAGCAVQEVLDEEHLLERTRSMGQRFGEILQERFAGHPQVGDIRGRGLFRALELVSDRASGEGFRNGKHLPDRLKNLALDAGLICYPGGIEVDGASVPHIMLAPPMILEESHMHECADRLTTVLEQAFG
jgi:adenosylmethionine-8-amino-7-oxononanoate aminotransferase